MKKILFVCIENSCRSQMAEALAHLIAPDVLDATSAGSRPSGKVNPLAVEVISELGYDLSTRRSKSLSEISAGKYKYVITMGCGDECPVIPAEFHEDWNIPDPKGKPLAAFRETRDLIAERVKELAQRVRVTNAKS
jgi:protein-tyrosine-phosphatase